MSRWTRKRVRGAQRRRKSEHGARPWKISRNKFSFLCISNSLMDEIRVLRQSSAVSSAPHSGVRTPGSCANPLDVGGRASFDLI